MRPAAFQKVPRDPGSSIRVFRREEAVFSFLLHVHPELELTLITAGGGLRYLGETIERYGPGDVVLVGSDVPHTWMSTESGPQAAIVVQFDEPLAHLIDAAPELAPARRLLESGPAVVFDAPQSVRREIAALERASGVERLARLLRLLAELPGLSRRPVAAGRTTGAGRSVIADVCRFVQERHGDDIRRAEAAAVAHMSESAFSRYFSRTTGRPFIRYVNEVRIAASCDRLLDSGEPVTAVAHAVGFRNLSNFNRQFVGIVGMSPRAFRRGHESASSRP